MSNVIEIHCADFAEKAVVLAYLQHLPDIYKQYRGIDVIEGYKNLIESDEKVTRVYLNEK